VNRQLHIEPHYPEGRTRSLHRIGPGIECHSAGESYGRQNCFCENSKGSSLVD
jgi:hypothetical protein